MKSDEIMKNEKVTSSTRKKESNDKLAIDFHEPKPLIPMQIQNEK